MAVETATELTVKVPRVIRDAIQEIANRMGRDFDSVLTEMLTESAKMQQIPGIVFADGPAGRRARIAGTGIEVFEVIRSFRSVNEDWESLRDAYDWLSEGQLQAALRYAMMYPDEIQARLRGDADWTPEHLWEKYPAMKPRR